MYNEKAIISQWIADMYDWNETYTDDVEFALSLMGENPKRVLEIACGSGRFMIPVAKAGHHVIGLDFDEFMLDKIAAKISNEKIEWYKADVIHEEWDTGFDVVVLGANFLYNIVSDLDYEQAQELVIQKAANALNVGGYVFIDCGYTQSPEKWFNHPEPNVVWEGIDSHGNFGKMTLLDSSYDEKSRMNKFVRRFEMVLKDGSNVEQEIPSEKHFASLEQIHHWLLKAGFVIEKEYGDYHCNPISESTSRAIIWARKMKETE
ncbi:MAG: class I SAM-dependent methyltransferase [Lachnospiraceae bacterium]|nr:class I SAM-dependent methyltransferase [Lachnospiraceae bacterium]